MTVLKVKEFLSSSLRVSGFSFIQHDGFLVPVDLKHRSQVAGQVTGRRPGHRSSQGNRKNNSSATEITRNIN